MDQAVKIVSMNIPFDCTNNVWFINFLDTTITIYSMHACICIYTINIYSTYVNVCMYVHVCVYV